MEIKIADIAKLRKMTGAGMMDCKKALQDAEGDFDRAQEIIREKGKLVAAKRADRDATEGRVVTKIIDNKAYIFCLACETDFVANSEAFEASVKEIFETAVKADAKNLEEVNALVGTTVTELTGKTGEKIEIAYYARIEAPMCSSYVHMNKKLGVILGFNKAIDETIGHEVAMQAAAMAPVSISKEDCPKEVIEREMRIAMEQIRAEGKPENMVEKIAEGKMNKFYKESTLLAQIKMDTKITVEEYIHEADKEATVVAYHRFSLND